MKKETLKKLVLLIVMAGGALLVGFNADKLSNGWNSALFVIGIAIIAMSNSIVGLLETVFKRKK